MGLTFVTDPSIAQVSPASFARLASRTRGSGKGSTRHDERSFLAQRRNHSGIEIHVILHHFQRRRRQPLVEREVRITLGAEEFEEPERLVASVFNVMSRCERVIRRTDYNRRSTDQWVSAGLGASEARGGPRGMGADQPQSLVSGDEGS